MALRTDSCPMPAGCGGASAVRGDSWQLRDISWRRVLGRQDFGSLVSSLVAIAALGITQACLGGPRGRPFMVSDATISYPHSGDSTVPYWLACTASALALLATILVCELLLARRLHGSLTDALAAALHFLLDGVAAFLVTGLATTVIKMVVGRLRPDFLDRCQPAIPSPLNVTYGLPVVDNPACLASPSGELTDGHYSFPSGHTSTVFVFSVWTVAYCVWAFYQRPPSMSASAFAACGLRERLLHDAGTALGFLWILALLAWAAGVSVSRITDFKHHPSDVVSGAFLGALMGLLFAVRAILRVSRVVDVPELAGAGCAGPAPSDGTPEPTHSLLLHPTNRAHDRQEFSSSEVRVAV